MRAGQTRLIPATLRYEGDVATIRFFINNKNFCMHIREAELQLLLYSEGEFIESEILDYM